MLLGADVYPYIIKDILIPKLIGPPFPLNTIFEYVLIFPISSPNPYATRTFLLTVIPQLDYLVERFWQIEEIGQHSYVSEEDEVAEKHFQSTHFRDSSGRYIVSYPFKSNAPWLELDNRAVVINTLTRLTH